MQQVENISTLDRLIATKQIAEMAGNDLIVQNLDIAINDLNELKVCFFKTAIFIPRGVEKNTFSNTMKKVMESTFTCKEEKSNATS